MHTSITPRFPMTQTGFTLIETLVTMGVMAVLTSLAIPSFSSLLARVRVEASLNAFSNSLHFARNEALSRNRTVLMCRTALITKTGALPVCDAAAQKSRSKQYAANDWASGWVVYAAPSNTSTALVDARQVLQVVATPPAAVSVILPNAAAVLRFTPLGHLIGGVQESAPGGVQDLALVVSHDAYPTAASHTKQRCISAAGRMQVSGVRGCV